VFSVVSGLPLGLDAESLKAASDRDARQLARLLSNPPDASFGERIGTEVDAIANALKGTLEQRRVAEQAARRVGRDPSFRASTDYALFWIQQIDPLTGDAAGAADQGGTKAKNAAILEVLSDLVVNLPILKPADSKEMSALCSLTTSDLEAVKDKPGIFQLNDQGKDKLKRREESS
jgi:hypothetical protein